MSLKHIVSPKQEHCYGHERKNSTKSNECNFESSGGKHSVLMKSVSSWCQCHRSLWDTLVCSLPENCPLTFVSHGLFVSGYQRQTIVGGLRKPQECLEIPVIKVQPSSHIFPNTSHFYCVPILYVPGPEMANLNILCVSLGNLPCNGEMATQTDTKQWVKGNYRSLYRVLEVPRRGAANLGDREGGVWSKEETVLGGEMSSLAEWLGGLKCPWSVYSESPAVLLRQEDTSALIEMTTRLDLHLPFLSLDCNWKHGGEKPHFYTRKRGRKERKPQRKRLGFLIADWAVYWGLLTPI